MNGHVMRHLIFMWHVMRDVMLYEWSRDVS